jgi:hypothetical protein
MNSNVNALRLSIPTGVYALCAYALLEPLLLLFAAIFWANRISGVLYLCTDSMGIFDFIPPFVHPLHGDMYYVAPWKIYLLWITLLTGVLLAPMSIYWLLSRLLREDQEHGT